MSEIRLSKDAQKMAAVIYREYLSARNNGTRKADAKFFSNSWESRFFPDENEKDLYDTLDEFKQFDFKFYLGGDFTISDSFIVYMENLKSDTIKEWLSFAAQFIP